MQDAPCYPIIYVRGYAMTAGEIDETTADPFCGFNLGSTVFRATPDKTQPAKKFIFESPVVRLNTDFGYRDVFENGLDIMDPGWTDPIRARSIIIYHYYEQASRLLGQGKTPGIEDFAKGLSDLVLRVRDLVCGHPENAASVADFHCYLVAHSMGGLVCRAFIQNSRLGTAEARRCIDKVFTYATPHNGIEMAGISIPGWLSLNDMSNFSRTRMADYLDLGAIFKDPGRGRDRVDWLPESAFPSERFFCMIGTNRADYEVASGTSRTFAGHGSDGLVRIENASVWGIDDAGRVSSPCATAYAYRSHSGFFGIVNSEESYQNLVRFLFGDVRVDIWVDIDDLRLPEDVAREADAGKDVNALYLFEVLASPRGKRWYLTRRIAEEDSVACRSHKDLVDPAKADARRIYLSSVFLANRWRVDPKRSSLAYTLTLGVRVPEFEVERKFWAGRHYEGGYLFRDSVVLEMTPPKAADEDWLVAYDWQSDKPGLATTPLDTKALAAGRAKLSIPFDSGTTPGIRGRLTFVVTPWNRDRAASR
jgi:hypothetical protein